MKFLARYIYLFLFLFLFFIFCPKEAYSQSSITEEVVSQISEGITKENLLGEEAAFQIFETITKGNRFLNKLTNPEGAAYNFPLGIKKDIGSINTTLAISNIKFNKSYGDADIYLQIKIGNESDKSKILMFGASGVKISYSGDLIGDVKLMLINSPSIPVAKDVSLEFKGGQMDDKTGDLSSDTYVTLNCDGDVKKMKIKADLLFNNNTFLPEDSTKNELRTNVDFELDDFNDVLVTVNIPPFRLKALPEWSFEVKHATLDLSDSKNPLVFNPSEEYFEKYFTLPDRKLWRGLYIDDISVKFPPMFNRKNGGRTHLEAKHFLLDKNGVTTDILGDNILPFDEGDADGCRFSVDSFQMKLLANNIQLLDFRGNIDLPYLKGEKPSKYEAFISKNEYFFKATFPEEKVVPLFGMGDLYLAETSIIQVGVKNGKFMPKAILDGYMEFDKDGLKMEQIVFEELALSTVHPFVSVKSAKYGGSIGYANFPLTISDLELKAKDGNINFAFDAKLNLMDPCISAETRIMVDSEIKDGGFEFKGVTLEKIRLDNIQMSGFKLDGEINIVKNDSTYGDYFGGNITAVFSALSEGLIVDVKSVFGRSDFRYWYVEGIAKLGKPIPVGGPLFIDGFVGGAYYRMQYTGQAGIKSYKPYKDCGLGVKGGLHYYIIEEKLISGNALLEMNFTKKSGIDNIMFYSTAEFLKKTKSSDHELDQMFSAGLGKTRCIGQSFTAGLSSTTDINAKNKELLENLNLSGIITAYAVMNYEFLSSTFDANFSVMVNAPGGFIRGNGSNGEAGSANLHLSPSTWYVHVGTPSVPLGLKLGLGPLSLSTESYFMFGDKLESPKLDPNVARILRVSPEQVDYMKGFQRISSGKGLAFGSRFSFDTGNITFLILYARLMAGTGFDVMLQDLTGYSCKGKSGPIGFDNWYANGQCYAYFQGEMGVKIKLFFIRKKISILDFSAAALLQARLPNPTWIGGYLGVNLRILGGLIKANMKMKLSFGDACEIVRNDGDYTPLDYPIIADLTPKESDSDVDTFISPQATFNMQLGEPFDAEDDKGNTHTYRIKIDEFYVADKSGNKIIGQIKEGKNMDASFISHDALPPQREMKAFISVNFEEYANGNWKLLTQNGNVARETKSVTFKTGEAPNYIPLTNIVYCYPVIDQKNFYKGESNSGYVQLEKGQPYLFPDGFKYEVSFTSPNRADLKVDFRYNSSEKRIDYVTPSLVTKVNYAMAFLASKEGSVVDNGSSTLTKTETIKDEESGEDYTVDYMQQAAKKIIKDGSLTVLDYSFRTSQYSTFEQKMSSFSFNRMVKQPRNDNRILYLKMARSHEVFDEAELNGVSSSERNSLIKREAVLDDEYYIKKIYPLIYKEYPIYGLAIQNRDINEVGLPPIKGFSIIDGYFREGSDARLAFPLGYNLQYYYYKDYIELRNKAANMFDKGIDMVPLQPLINSQFPAMLEGTYKTKLQYTMPGSKQGTQKTINYINWY